MGFPPAWRMCAAHKQTCTVKNRKAVATCAVCTPCTVCTHHCTVGAAPYVEGAELALRGEQQQRAGVCGGADVRAGGGGREARRAAAAVAALGVGAQLRALVTREQTLVPVCRTHGQQLQALGIRIDAQGEV